MATTDKLTEVQVKNTKPTDAPYKISDGGGMYLLVNPTGGKYWHLAYRYNNKQKLLALGVYPEVTLAKARKAREKARKLIKDGIDPSEEKKAAKKLADLQSATTFEAIAREWLDKQTHLAEVTQNKSKWLLDFAIAGFGKKAITDVTAPDVLAVCQLLEKQEKRETARRIKVKCGQVFRYAIQTGRATYDPTQALKGALQPVVTTHHAAITDPVEVAELLRAIAGYKGQFVTLCALKLSPLVFVRPNELRHALWVEIDLNAAEWRYRVSKTNTDHIVPLSTQAVGILKELHSLTGHGKYVFPSIRTNSRPMSENTINPALRRLGYSSEQMCGHGFRAMARTLLEEVLGYPYDIIEQQLAHTVRDPNGRAYNRTKHLEARHKMMQHWSDYLDSLQVGNVISVRLDGGLDD